MSDAMRDLFYASVQGNSGPTLPDGTTAFVGDAFLLVGDDGVKRLHVWNGAEWIDATKEHPIYPVQIDK